MSHFPIGQGFICNILGATDYTTGGWLDCVLVGCVVVVFGGVAIVCVVFGACF